MNKIILAASLALISLSVYSQANPQTGYYSVIHDSLLFDGSGEVTTMPTKRAGDCYIRVIYAHGLTEGTYYVTKTYEVCGEWDTMHTTEKGKLTPMNELKIGEEITTGENSALELKMYDGSYIRMGPNSKIKITGNMCESQTFVHVMGKIWTKVKKIMGKAKYEVRTERTCVCVRGTEFSVETTEESEIIRVYEGSVSFSQSSDEYINAVKSKSEQMEQINKDYQNGKISLEEFTKKMGELMQVVSETSPQGVTINAGYESRITGTDKPTEPVTFETTGSEWFDDVNFKK